MSKRREIERQVRSLNDIGEIMNAMKNLSLMESHRLSRFIETQRRVVTSIESAADDFLAFWPQGLPNEDEYYDLYLLAGAERGFCGDFNESLVRALDRDFDSVQDGVVIVIGSKLTSKLAGDRRIGASLDGANVVEEVEQVLVKLTDTLSTMKATRAGVRPLRLTVLHHTSEAEGVTLSVLRPFKKARTDKTRFAYAPMLNLDPQSFLRGLVEMYLFAALQELLYSSLLAENQRRMQHMDSAVRRLERTSEELVLRRNVLRQEEITEEIEIIMLSVGALRQR
ncbi:MAG TPA: FoF1 ATP synthase subunit gamma [Terriglobales bacterium]|nr:FoF1 ATP synthase subunit gamma [Terriglobales bacterium]